MIRCIMEHVNLNPCQGEATDIETVDISVFRMKNDVENGNHLEAKYLIKADSSVSFCANKERKSPLYVAAEAGLIEIVTLINDSITVQNNTGDQGSGATHINVVVEGKSPVHAAIFCQKEDVLGLISRMQLNLKYLKMWQGGLHCIMQRRHVISKGSAFY